MLSPTCGDPQKNRPARPDRPPSAVIPYTNKRTATSSDTRIVMDALSPNASHNAKLVHPTASCSSHHTTKPPTTVLPPQSGCEPYGAKPCDSSGFCSENTTFAKIAINSITCYSQPVALRSNGTNRGRPVRRPPHRRPSGAKPRTARSPSGYSGRVGMAVWLTRNNAPHGHGAVAGAVGRREDAVALHAGRISRRGAGVPVTRSMMSRLKLGRSARARRRGPSPSGALTRRRPRSYVGRTWRGVCIATRGRSW